MCIRDSLKTICRRAGSHGAGRYQLPGGHLEMGEVGRGAAVKKLRRTELLGRHGSNVQFVNVRKKQGLCWRLCQK
eukprot:766514-Hanusia_phi.AAC.9